ncbi:MAG: hypothetical protein MJ067_01835 [Oscillospiraceae bacterium]|nr:hypothetical protein [Oscillospiraceae bacterium]
MINEKTIVFTKLPSNAEELKAMPEASLDEACKTVALTLAALMNYEKNPEETFRMLDFLKGPENVSPYEKQFIAERLKGKQYKVSSFFCGAAPENNYTPAEPLSVVVGESVNSFSQENWVTMYVVSGGADSPRSVKLRRKPSTGQWFLNEIQCLSDIREPKESDPWA